MNSYRLVAGLLLVVALGAIVVPSVASQDPRGIRNNNPANLVKTGIKWRGEEKCDDKRFECFSEPFYGIRAMYKTLHTYYYKYELRTLHEILHRWSPVHENNTREIIRYLNDTLSIGPNDVIPIWDMDFLVELGIALITIENGYSPYDEQLIRRAAHNAIGNNHPAWQYADRGATKIVVNEPEGQSTTEPVHAPEYESTGEPLGRRESREVRRVRIYSEDYCNSLYLRNYSLASDGSGIQQRTSDAWLDRMGIRFLVFYGRQGCYDMEDSDRFSYYASPYTFSGGNQWAILRRKYRWSPLIRFT